MRAASLIVKHYAVVRTLCRRQTELILCLMIVYLKFFFFFSFFFLTIVCAEGDLPMAEDWSVCFKICATEPGLAPYRYFDTLYCFTVTQEYQMQIIQNKRWMVYVF